MKKAWIIFFAMVAAGYSYNWNYNDGTWHVNFMTKGMGNAVWFGAGSSVWIYDDSVYTNFDLAPESVPNFSIKTIFLDNDNRMWCFSGGKNTNEYVIYVNNQFDTLASSSYSEMPYEECSSISQTNNGDIWASYTGGPSLILYRNEQWGIVDANVFGFPGDTINHIKAGLNDTLFVGFKSSGIGFINNDMFQQLNLNDSISITRVHDIEIDKNGMLVIAHSDGVLVRNDGDFSNYTSINSAMPSGVILGAAIDCTGGVWCMAQDGDVGLGVLKNNEWEVFNTGNSIMQEGYYRDVVCNASNEIILGHFHFGFYIISTDVNNQSPVLLITDSLEIDEGNAHVDTITATDPDNDAITYTFLNVPSWGSASDSILTLNPTASDDSVTITIIASDGNGGADTAEIFFEVIHPTSSSIKRTKNNTNLFTFTIDSQTLSFPKSGLQEIVVLDMQGRQVRNFKQLKTSIGWDGMDHSGRVVPSGNYLVKAVYSEKRRVKSEKIVLMR